MAYDIKNNLDEKSHRIGQPEKIIIPLKEHQKTIIYHARKLESLKPFDIGPNKQMITQFGVICDHVGAGKSYEVLGTIASSPSLNHNLKLQYFTDLSNYTIYPNSKKIDTNIIVVPHGVFKQWEDYITKSTKLKSYSINTFQSLKNILKDYLLDELYEFQEAVFLNQSNRFKVIFSDKDYDADAQIWKFKIIDVINNISNFINHEES